MWNIGARIGSSCSGHRIACITAVRRCRPPPHSDYPGPQSYPVCSLSICRSCGSATIPSGYMAWYPGVWPTSSLFTPSWRHALAGLSGWVINTPSAHRVHHASNPEYIDKNFGGVLLIWDRLFGSYQAERPDIDIRYGLAHPRSAPNNPFVIAYE